ncbi:hypothetical protein QE381_002597 [Microbacterium sp. SORGH_AS 888]|nr:hypothetical protein [Microbacterium sp. SORGH_AS_0888]
MTTRPSVKSYLSALLAPNRYKRLSGADDTVLSEIPPPTEGNFTNPSICTLGEYTFRTIREVNYRISPWTGKYVTNGEPLSSRTWITQISPEREKPAFRALHHKDRSKYPMGLEDARVFAWRNELWAVFSAATWEDDFLASKMILARISGDEIIRTIEMPSPHGSRKEKNWAPLIRGDDLYFIYDLNSLEVYRWTGQELELHNEPNEDRDGTDRLSGSSQFVRWGKDGGYIGVTHTSIQRPRRLLGLPSRIYFHRFAYIDASLSKLHLSRPFFFQKRGIEFCAGILVSENSITLTFGSGDCHAREIRLPSTLVSNLLCLDGLKKEHS